MTSIENRHSLPNLPYAIEALEPHISRETVHYHYDIHHRGYVEKLNALIVDSEFKYCDLAEVVMTSTGDIFNNAAQIWNHNFYWQCLSPEGGGAPDGDLRAAIDDKFGSFAEFQTDFSALAVALFGSGWAWLVQNADGAIDIMQTGNAGCPIRSGHEPLLACDMWEHAYYIDHRNRRPDYMRAFWSLVNWQYAAAQYRA